MNRCASPAIDGAAASPEPIAQTRFVSNYDLSKLPGREHAHAAAKLFRDHVSRVLLFEFSYANTPTHGSSGRRLHRCRLLLPASADSERQSVFRFRAWRLLPLRDAGTADRSRHRSVPTNRLMGGKFRRRMRSRRRLLCYKQWRDYVHQTLTTGQTESRMSA